MSFSRSILVFILIFPLFYHLSAQDITGVWTGSITTNGNELPYQVAISGTNDKLTGYSLTIFTIDGKENTGLKSLKVKLKKNKVTIEDGDLVEDDYSTKAKRVMLFAVLDLRKEKATWVLSGNFNSRAYFDQNYKGRIHLIKKSDFIQTKLFSKLGQLNLLNTLSFIEPITDQRKVEPTHTEPEKEKETDITLAPSKEKAKTETIPEKKIGTNVILPSATETVKVETPIAALPAADLAKRTTNTIQTVYFSSDSLILSIYDNGQVDGDTVSVLLNGSTIIAQKRLSGEPITKTIYTPPSGADSLQLIMYAENLGTIPPNTGILIIQDGENRYQVRFEGDLQRNSAIILKRKKGF